MRIVQKWWGTNKEELEVLFTDPPLMFVSHQAMHGCLFRSHSSRQKQQPASSWCRLLWWRTTALWRTYDYPAFIEFELYLQTEWFASLFLHLCYITNNTNNHSKTWATLDSLIAMSCYCHYSLLAQCLFSVWIEQLGREFAELLQHAWTWEEHLLYFNTAPFIQAFPLKTTPHTSDCVFCRPVKIALGSIM